MHPSLVGPPSDPAEIEQDDHVSTVVVPVAALACDVVGWVPIFDHSRALQVADAM
jgi:hypothetical protein